MRTRSAVRKGSHSMVFQRARKEEQRERRRQEILDAAWELFEQGGLEMVTFSTIGAKVSFTRQTIYTYYRSRDEVLLDLLSRRMEDFYQDIRAMFPIGKPVTQRTFCEKLVDHLLTHKKLLALFSLHITLETKARYENILSFKRTMYEAFPVFCTILRDQCSGASEDACCYFCLTIMVYSSSIHPMIDQTPLQMKALQEASGGMSIPTDRELILSSLMLMTGSFHFRADGEKDESRNPQ